LFEVSILSLRTPQVEQIDWTTDIASKGGGPD
jgi:hypothetical protein